MELIVTNRKLEKSENTVHITFDEFKQKCFHPFIAVNNWDVVRIELNEETPVNIIPELINYKRVVPIFDKDNITPRVVQLLREIVPNKSAELRITYVKDKTKFKKLVDELIEERGWLNV